MTSASNQVTVTIDQPIDNVRNNLESLQRYIYIYILKLKPDLIRKDDVLTKL